jgi:hypothetical protein
MRSERMSCGETVRALRAAKRLIVGAGPAGRRGVRLSARLDNRRLDWVLAFIGCD